MVRDICRYMYVRNYVNPVHNMYTCVSIPNRTTDFLSGAVAMTSSTSGITMENTVLGNTCAELTSISDTVLPSPAVVHQNHWCNLYITAWSIKL